MTRLTIIRGGSADPTGTRGRSFRDAADQGALVRLTPGRFVDATEWRRATPGERHIARIKAVHDRIAPRLVVAHASAAALHGLPWRGEFPDVVEVIDPERSTTQSLTHVRKRPGRGRRLRTQYMIANGRRVTDLTSTVADLAISFELRLSVPALDVALAAGCVLADVRTEIEARGAVHGRHRAAVALELADGASGSPGESVARVALDEVGAPRPVLQRASHDDAGFIGRVDFWFPEQGVVLEFDGRTKYVDPALRRPGMSAADVVVTEKRREDRLRRHREVRGFGRFGWDEANDLDALRAVLRGVGVPTAPRSFRHVR
ncbi:hypothetical protein JOE58_001349 [Curtobacterium luteum]|uniref:Transcriptional regulator, AbiEi antitoxin, Type IV TA system n=1 Tax=Curtobacterium luteum TaxID=33881 RepID=A0A8H9GAX0_9MICO|nr:hypothetical protein [Curtobacterium luteum]MBM7802098.1 hypothetical protein [Curtobacterium luteum]NUU52208.1 hypothetical protein [Curtobacterium luteum]GGL04345.1 hypothetical protein GCM10009769_23100 [Curtobacterium luteum]